MAGKSNHKQGQESNKQSWLQRQHSRARKNGDAIAARIGKGAQNVVVGKNIVQFIGNTLNLPHHLAAIIVGLVTVMAMGVVLLAAIAFVRAYPALFHKPTPMGGVFNIAVADFGVLDAQGRVQKSDKAQWLSRWLAEQLNTSVAVDKLHIEVRHDEVNHSPNDPAIGVIKSEKQAEQQLAALGADLLIYGNLTRPDDPASLQLQLNRPINRQIICSRPTLN
jgi:hypothetical protein